MPKIAAPNEAAAHTAAVPAMRAGVTGRVSPAVVRPPLPIAIEKLPMKNRRKHL